MSGGSGSSTAVTIVVSALTAAVVTVATQLLLQRHDVFDQLVPKKPPPAAPQELLVPELIGLSREGADVRLQDRGLRLEVSAERPSADVEPGKVLEQTPLPASRVLKGAAVRVVIASAPAAVEIPALVDQPLAQARATLEALGLKLGPVEETPGGTPGHVVKVVPPVGQRVMPGQFVVLTVAADNQRVPEVVGLRVQEATERLRGAGLKVGRTRERYDSNRRAYVVLSQDPEAGAAVEPGSRVDLVINEGD